mgnify:CR=1 FL=1
MKIFSDYFTPIDENSIPTGKLRSVKGTPFDFSTLRIIGNAIEDDDDVQLTNGNGYDHNYVIRMEKGNLRKAATVISASSGIVLDILTTEPGVQFYSGNYLQESIKGRENITYNFRNGFCLETQHFPDSPNRPHFPSTLLKKGDKFNLPSLKRLTNEIRLRITVCAFPEIYTMLIYITSSFITSNFISTC